ncbi:PPE family protein, partial [Mycobacterium sp.]|uniref:PPE family protein n=1 Tax=Mycobacterium sp. TaxID=1785 RepID=UPI002C0789E4
MDFGALPPEINSARMYSGSGSDSMLAAAAAWDKLADDLYSTAAAFNAVVVALTDDDWRGDAADAMVDAVTPYVRWLTTTAEQAEAVAGQARAAASAFENALAATVPPLVIEANRARLASLIAGNAMSLDTPGITALEADYGEMWAQDVSAMYRYAGASALATKLTPLAAPTVGDDPPGLTGADAGIPDMLAQAMAAVPRALRSLGRPAQSASATAAMNTMLRLRPFQSPVSAFAATISSPASMTSSGTSAAAKSPGLPE